MVMVFPTKIAVKPGGKLTGVPVFSAPVVVKLMGTKAAFTQTDRLGSVDVAVLLVAIVAVITEENIVQVLPGFLTLAL